MTHQVIELHFDKATSEKLFDIWKQLEQAGFGPLPAGSPHLSLASFGSGDPDKLASGMKQLVPSRSFQVSFGNVGVFLRQSCVVFLGIIPTFELNQLHKRIHDLALSAAKDLHPYYAPDQIVFHSTLANVERARLGVLMDVITTLDLPTHAVVEDMRLVEYFPATDLIVHPFIASLPDSGNL
jgi:2'-5' RNA ligase